MGDQRDPSEFRRLYFVPPLSVVRWRNCQLIQSERIESGLKTQEYTKICWATIYKHATSPSAVAMSLLVQMAGMVIVSGPRRKSSKSSIFLMFWLIFLAHHHQPPPKIVFHANDATIRAGDTTDCGCDWDTYPTWGYSINIVKFVAAGAVLTLEFIQFKIALLLLLQGIFTLTNEWRVRVLGNLGIWSGLLWLDGGWLNEISPQNHS